MRRLYPFLAVALLAACAGCHRSQPTVTNPPAAPVPLIASVPVAHPQPLIAAPIAIPHKTTPHYTVTDVGTLPGFDASEGIGINNHGWVVANAVTHSKFDDNSVAEARYAFLSHNGVLTALTRKVSSAVGAINNRGEVTGWTSPDGGSPEPFLYNHVTKTLGRVKYGDARGVAINDHGVVVINETDADDKTSFLYWHGKTQEIRQPTRPKPGEFEDALAFGINGRRQVIVGLAEGYFLYKDGKFQRLKHFNLPLGYVFVDSNSSYGRGHCTNDRGDFVGRIQKQDGIQGHGFWYNDGRMRDLGTISGYQISAADAINNRRQIVGAAYNYVGSEIVGHAFLYAHGKMHDLNDLLPVNSGWVLEEAHGINDRGQIVGTGKHNGKTRAFVLTPL